MYRWLLALIFAAISGALSAQTYHAAPADGLWWNQAESGRGWTFETQNNITVVTHYTYGVGGASTFYTTAGVWDGINRTFTGALSAFSGGQCVGCTYTPPLSADLGAMRFTFTSATQGVAVYPNGTTIPIQKYNFIYADPRAYMKGEWASVWVGTTLSDFGNFIRFNANCTVCVTPNSVQGSLILSGSAGRLVLASPVPGSSTAYVAIIDSTATIYEYFFIIAEANSWTGLGCAGFKSSPAPSPSQCSGILFASRMKTQAAAGISSVNSASKSVSGERSQRLMAESLNMSKADVPPELKNLETSWSSLAADMRRLAPKVNAD